ncbi:hypothetical protein NSK_006315 [Nannochloropsis salina CCMP1776]|uniref:RNA helicase n=1 Tax=Nannochloropsis salina CCMP1776 TaxID=1027361 RepID=A0A4D9CU58_9STRA|nr:hypothetical protein NSK_006315 [Nannochloropsis salina CCMP1776]|eukprot:TFJ82406.1 hypothetical protein NSK_006315 [Nannochloropsis salina CCMP1776]
MVHGLPRNGRGAIARHSSSLSSCQTAVSGGDLGTKTCNKSSSLDKSEILTDVEDSKEIRERTDSEEEGGRHGGHGAPYSGEKHLGRDYYSKRFRLLVQYMVEGGPPTAMREEMETRGDGLPSFQWKMAVVNFMNQAFLWPQDTLKDQYLPLLHALDDVPGAVMGSFHNTFDAWHAKVRRHSYTMSGEKPALPPLPPEFMRVEAILLPFIVRSLAAARPLPEPSLAGVEGEGREESGEETELGGERQRMGESTVEKERKAMKDSDLGQLVRVCDMRLPHDWYPYARLMRRKIIYHAGPTNSGKTYHALQRLKIADPAKGGGLYLGPLRLLALEIYDTLNEEGVYCSLLTGQEKRLIPFSDHTSATVEMCSLRQDYDVAVLDEIQMIGDPERGHAWTRALLGLRAKEIHLCGGPEAVDVVSRLCQATEDDLEIRKYERMTELTIASEPLLDYSKVMAGDCIVAFSKSDICSIKQEIEAKTSHKCCMVYGSLPSETRSAQARIFNEEGTGFDVLVATDAIGMGLNLNIRRIIFHSLIKVSDEGGAEVLHSGLGTATEQIARAGLFPSPEQLEDFASLLESQVGRIKGSGELGGEEERWQQRKKGLSSPLHASFFARDIGLEMNRGKKEENGKEDTGEEGQQKSEEEEEGLGLMEVMDSFFNMAEVSDTYHMCRSRSMASIASYLAQVKPLSIAERYILSSVPISSRDRFAMQMLYQFAAARAARRPMPLSVRLPASPPTTLLGMNELCTKHSVLDAYLWLSHKFPSTFVQRESALQMRVKLTRMLESGLKLGMLVEHSHHDRDARLRHQFALKMEKLHGIPYKPPAPSQIPPSIGIEEDTGAENDDEEEEEERWRKEKDDEAEHAKLLEERGEGKGSGTRGSVLDRQSQTGRRKKSDAAVRVREGKGFLSDEEEEVIRGLFAFRLARFHKELEAKRKRKEWKTEQGRDLIDAGEKYAQKPEVAEAGEAQTTAAGGTS